MMFDNQRLQRSKEKMKQIMKDVEKHIYIYNIGDIFRNQNGKTFDYIKGIEEIDNLAIVKLKGSIDSYTIPIITANLGSKIEEYLDKHVLLDFKEVTHIDSATLASFIQVLSRLKKHNRKLGVINATPLLKNYLYINKIEPLIHIYKSEKAALEDLM
jgi:anti-anti-sigma factor